MHVLELPNEARGRTSIATSVPCTGEREARERGASLGTDRAKRSESEVLVSESVLKEKSND